DILSRRSPENLSRILFPVKMIGKGLLIWLEFRLAASGFINKFPISGKLGEHLREVMKQLVASIL
ncbi:MAG: hypothetical protein AAFQ83_24960, partial [Bacteroidota bacterium]